MRSKVIFGVVGASCVLIMWMFARLYKELLIIYEQSGTFTDIEYSWFFRLLLNLAGYATVLVPVFILYKYIETTNYFDKITSPSCVSRFLFACFGSYERLGEPRGRREPPPREGLELAFCFTGLMAAYLVWGLLQEKIMTQTYVLGDGTAARFSESQLLVLVNRLGALLVALLRLVCTKQAVLAAPLCSFSYCALTNVVSAWCQYEALKYVSFPTQVLSKSCKVIPVMLMGKLISRNKYETYEYVTAALISLGMVLFLSGAGVTGAGVAGAGAAGAAGAIGGAALLALYLCCDSFTSSWQAALFARHSLQPLQMLAAVNAWSVLLTATSLSQHTVTATSLSLLRSPAFLTDCALLSLSSALGQLLIYRTIAKFGAVVFAIIMTVRQAVSILVSCVVYGHAVSWGGAAGVALVFAAVLLRLRARARAATPAPLAN